MIQVALVVLGLSMYGISCYFLGYERGREAMLKIVRKEIKLMTEKLEAAVRGELEYPFDTTAGNEPSGKSPKA